MRTTKVVIAVVIASLLCGSALWAEPTLKGYTGLLMVPTAETLGDGDYHLGISTGEDGDWEDFHYYGAFGIGNDTEVGLTMWRPRGAGNQTYLHAKRGMGIVGGADFAAGVFDLTGEDQTTVYAVATWEQGRVVGEVDDQSLFFVNLHAGLGAGMIDGIFAGVEFMLGPNVGIMAEWIDNGVNLGARLRPLDQLVLDAGLTDIDQLVVNVSYNRSF